MSKDQLNHSQLNSPQLNSPQLNREEMIALLHKEELALPEMQRFHQALDAAKQFDTDFIKNVGYMVAEVGEVVQAYRTLDRADGAESQTDAINARVHIGEELADCLAYLLKLANYAQIDLHTSYVRKMTHNVDRTWGGVDTTEK